MAFKIVSGINWSLTVSLLLGGFIVLYSFKSLIFIMEASIFEFKISIEQVMDNKLNNGYYGDSNKYLSGQNINERAIHEDRVINNRKLSIGGNTVFPIGLFTTLGVDKKSSASLLAKSREHYSAELIDKLMLRIAQGGFDFIQSYAVPYYAEGIGFDSRVTAQSRLLDSASRQGLKVLLNLGYLSDPKAMGSLSQNDIRNLEKEIKSMLDAVKENPSLIGYYIADEPFPANVPVELLEKIYKNIKIHDPKNPILLVDIDQRAIKKYVHTTDIISTDIYPIIAKGKGLNEYFMRLLSFRNEIKRIDSKKIFWNVVQLSRLNEHSGPTIQELHAMTFASIIAGSQGIMYFSFDFPDGPLPICNPGLWDSAISAVNRVKSLEKIILSERVYHEVNIDSMNVKAYARLTEEMANSYLNIIAARLPPMGEEEMREVVKFNLGALTTHENEISVSELSAGQTKPITRIIYTERTKNGAISFIDSYDGISTKVYRLKIEHATK